MKTWSYAAAGALLLAALGCHDDTTAPAEPQGTVPQPDVVAAAALTFQQMSGGRGHTCALTSTNAAWCWGDNATGALGTGDATGPEGCFGYNGPIPCSSRPTPVIGGRQFRSISAGDGYTCAITTDFRAYCWGLNSFSELGIGSSVYQTATPLAVAGGHQFRQIDAGVYHTCGVSYPDNRLYCWGTNTYGQLPADEAGPRAQRAHVQAGRRWPVPHLCRDYDRSRVLLGPQQERPARRQHYRPPPYQAGEGGGRAPVPAGGRGKRGRE